MQRRSIGYADRFTGWTYAPTESKVVLTYLKLALWPSPLVFDYGPELMISRVAEAAPYLLILSLLLSLALVASRRWPPRCAVASLSPRARGSGWPNGSSGRPPTHCNSSGPDHPTRQAGGCMRRSS